MCKEISIIIPCYNVEQYIDRCMESLVSQSMGLEKLEIILVDDASSDGTLQKLKEWEERYPDSVLLVVCEKNGRQGTARNIGLSYSSAPVIAYVDADDWVEPEMFGTMYRVLEETGAELVACRSGRDWGDGELCMIDDYQGPVGCLQQICSDKDRHELLRLGLCSGVWGKLYRKDFLLENDISFPEGVTYEDNYFISLVSFCVSSFVVCQEVFYHYFFNENSTVSQKNSTHQYDRLQVELMIHQELHDRGFGGEFSHEIEKRFIKNYYIGTLHIIFTRFTQLPYAMLDQMQKQVWALYPDCLHGSVYDSMEEIDQIIMSTLKRSFRPEEWMDIAGAYREFCDEINREANRQS